MRRCAGGAAILLATACGGGGAGDAGFEVRDSAGVRIAESGLPATERLPVLAPEPRLDIGVRDGAAEYQLTAILDALLLSDGSIAVADGGAHRVRVYSADGQHLRSLGGEGDGPGEFRVLANLVRFAGDTLGVHDGRHRRISVFDPAGSLVREIPLEPRQEQRVGVRAAPDGSFIAMSPSPLAPPARTGVIERPVGAVVRYDAAGVLVDTIIAAPGAGLQLIDVGFDQPVLGAIPYGGASHVRLSGDTIVLGTAERCELQRLAADGRLLGLTRWDCDLAVTEQDVTRWKEHALDMARREQPDALPMLTRLVEQTAFPATRAAYGSFLVSADGSIWLAEPPLPLEEPSSWTILDAEGRLLGALEMPERFVPLEVGRDYVLGRWSDELDVQHVRLYHLAVR